jgi:aconitate hydratase
VIGVEIKGTLKEGLTATDVVLTVTQMLRRLGVVGKFVEFFGEGLEHLSLADRATISNMAPEYGATCCFFPTDQETLKYLRLTGRSEEQIALVEQYTKEQGLWSEKGQTAPVFTEVVTLDLSSIESSISGPTRPQDKITVKESSQAFKQALHHTFKVEDENKKVPVSGKNYEIEQGSIVIGAITSCTNTSNPAVMLAAGLVAKKAREKGLSTKPWVKTSLSPGSQVVSDYLDRTGLQKDLDALGFQLVGYGCMTCIGNSGPLEESISQAIHQGNLVACAVLSGNRNFEGRINPDVRANYLASPPLVIAYSIAGTMKIDFNTDPVGYDQEGKPVFLRDIWPTTSEIQTLLNKNVFPDLFKARYSNVFKGDENWQELGTAKEGSHYEWDPTSTYIKHPPYFEGMELTPSPLPDIKGAYVLAMLGDSITTDHISPAGSIKKDSPAGKYLIAHGISPENFNSYGSRRGNHEVMVRGTFANIRLRNEMVPGTEGGVTQHIPTQEVMSIFDAAMKYQSEHLPLIVIAGKEYGSGSSRDWAAKGVRLLGVKAILAESFERIHRSNLIGMGILPLQFAEGTTRKSLQLTGKERFDIQGLHGTLTPRMQVTVTIHREDGTQHTIPAICCINTATEAEYYRHGGILHYVIRKLLSA